MFPAVITPQSLEASVMEGKCCLRLTFQGWPQFLFIGFMPGGCSGPS